MNIPTIVLLTWFALNVLIVITSIGKQRQPITPTVAAIVVVLYGVMATLVVLA